jgi:malate permease and related proteins
MDDFLPLASKVVGVFLVMATGGLARQLGWLNQQADRSLAALTANVLLPALFFARVSVDQASSGWVDSWLPMLMGIAVTLFGFLVAWLSVLAFGRAVGLVEPSSRRAFILCAGMCNYGYIPLPLAELFFPSAVVNLMVYNVGVDLAMWSAGIWIISGGHASRKRWWQVLLSPPLLAVLMAVAARESGLARVLPQPIYQWTGAMGVCAIPMGLILGGAIIVDHLNWQTLIRRPAVTGLAILLRQVLLPTMLLGLASLGWFSRDLTTVLMLQAAMPAATFPIVLTQFYGQDTQTGTRVVVITSLLGLVTIPLWIAFGRWLLGL